MDPRERADAALARARARSAYVVTPDDAVSPMDAASTLQIPRAMVNAADQGESTMVIPAAMARGDQTPPRGYPQQQPMQPQHNGQQHTQQHNGQPYPNGQQHDGGQYDSGYYDTGHYDTGHYDNNYDSGHHQPVPYPAGHQSGPHQPVPQPPAQPQAQQPQAQPPQAPEQQPDEQQTPRQLDGLVPTTQHPGTQRSMLSRRLDGN